jgi:hypothetical protein
LPGQAADDGGGPLDGVEALDGRARALGGGKLAGAPRPRIRPAVSKAGVRSWMRSRSNSACAAKAWKMSLPSAVVSIYSASERIQDPHVVEVCTSQFLGHPAMGCPVG